MCPCLLPSQVKPKPTKPNQLAHTHIHTSTLRVIAFQSTQLSSHSFPSAPCLLINPLSLSLFFLSLSFSISSGMRITSGINRISLGDASCTHNTRSFFFVCVCAFSLLFSYGLCLWHRLTRHRTLKKKKKKKNKKKSAFAKTETERPTS